MKKFSKLLAVVLAIAVVICPMMSVVANADGAPSGTYTLTNVDATHVKLSIDSTDGFLVYKATLNFPNGGYVGLTVDSYSLLEGDSAKSDGHTNPSITVNANDNGNVTFLVEPTDAACLKLYTNVTITITVAANGTEVKLTNIQAADEGTVDTDATLLDFPAADANGDIDVNDPDYPEEAAETESHTHSLTAHPAVAATCIAGGNTAYWSCDCGKYFSDANAQTEIEDGDWVTSIDAANHSNLRVYSTYQAATHMATGTNASWYCEGCKNYYSNETGTALISFGDITIAKDPTHVYDQKVSTDAYKVADATCEAPATYYYSCECGDIGSQTYTVGNPLGHDYAYTDNGNGTHAVSCERAGCTYSATEDCADVDPADGACDKCGATLVTEPIVDNNISITAAVSIQARINIKYTTNKRDTINPYYDHFDVVVVPTKYSMDAANAMNKFVAEPIVLTDTQGADKKNFIGVYDDVAMFEFGLNIDCYVRCYNAKGNLVATSPVLSLIPSEKMTAMVNNDLTMESTRTVITDLLNMGAASENYFGSLYMSSDLVADVQIHGLANAGLTTQEFATKDFDFGSLSSVNTAVWENEAPLTSSNNTITPNLYLGVSPTINIQMKKIKSLDDSFTFNVSYQSNNTSVAPYSRDYKLSDFTFSGAATTGKLALNDIAYYDGNATLTFTVFYQGVKCCTYTYSVESAVSKALGSVTGLTKTLEEKIAIFGASARAYIAQ